MQDSGQEAWQPGILERLLDDQSLKLGEVQQAIHAIMSGNWLPEQTAAFLVALRAKGETIEEIAGAARTMKSFAQTVEGATDALDIVGTGGDGAGSVNISTAASFVARGAGARIAKHGNRSVSSRSGSADVLEALGAVVELQPNQTQQVFEACGYCFMYAPQHHPSMKFVAPVRRNLGVRTVFNLLGPLTNPASATKMLVGVYERDLVEPFAYVLKFMGVERAVVVYGDPGYDEFSTCGTNHIACLDAGQVSTTTKTAAELGAAFGQPEDIKGGDAKDNADIIRTVLGGQEHPARASILLNAGVSLYCAGLVDQMHKGYAMATEAVASGKALQAMQAYVDATQNT